MSRRSRTLFACLLAVLTAGGTTGANAAPGQLDTSFGTDGEVLEPRSDTAGGSGDTVHDVLLQPNGKELAIGVRTASTTYSCRVLRYDDGRLDATYGQGGVADVGALVGRTACASAHGVVTASGALVIAAYSEAVGDPGGGRVLLHRLTPEGALDTTFGAGGTAQVDPAGSAVLELAAQASGALLAVVGGAGGTTAHRFSPEGVADLAYGTGGQATFPEGFIAVAAQGDRLVAMFSTYDHPDQGMPGVANPIKLGRWTAEGQRDGGFGTVNTNASHDLAKAESFETLAASPERIAVGGQGVFYRSGSTNFDDQVFASIKTFGPDGQGGGESTPFLLQTYPYGDAFVSALAFTPDGMLVAAGQHSVHTDTSSRSGLHVSRFSATGAPDTSWDGDGSAAFLRPDAQALPRSIVADGDGIIVGGVRREPNQPAQLWHLLRLQSGAASVCLLPPEDGAAFPEAATVPPSGTVTGFHAPREGGPGSRSASSAAASGKPTKGSLVFGSLVAVGCFSDLGGGRWQAESPNTRLNGIDLTRGSSSLVIDVNTRRITSSGPVRISVGNQTLRHERIAWAITGSTLALGTPDEGIKLAKFRGMAIHGSAHVEFSRDGNEGSTTWTLGLAFPTTNWSSWKYGRTLRFEKGVNGPGFDVSFTSSNTNGAVFKGLNFKADELVIANRFKLTEVAFGLDFPSSVWSAKGKFTLPGGKVVAGAAARDANGWRGLTASLDGAGVPLFSGIFLQRLEMGFDVADKDGTATPAVSGGAGFSVGPKIPLPGGKSTEAASVDGKLTFSYLRPGVDVYRVDGNLKVVDRPLSAGYMTIQDGGHKTDFHGTIDLRSKKGSLLPYQVTATIDGWAESTTGFNAQGGATASFLGLAGNGQLLMSSEGYGVCIGGDGIRVGYGYSWGNDTIEWFAKSCDVGRFRQVRGRASRAAIAARGRASVTLPAGLPLAVLRVRGGASAPAVTVRGPGVSAVTPADGSAQTAKVSIAQNPEERVTYVVLVRPARGTYVVSGPGVRGVQMARGLTTPVVEATVAGAGPKRTLSWAAGDLDGQTLEFVEETAEGRAVLARSSKAKGTVSFTPQSGASHTVTAHLLNGGVPRDSVKVASFSTTAAGTTLARPAGLKLKRTRTGVTIAFKAVPGAAGYRVRTSVRRGGKTVRRTVTTKRLKVVVKLPRGVTTVAVTALAPDGAPGAPSTARLR